MLHNTTAFKYLALEDPDAKDMLEIMLSLLNIAQIPCGPYFLTLFASVLSTSPSPAVLILSHTQL